jgi:hypothetical protein
VWLRRLIHLDHSATSRQATFRFSKFSSGDKKFRKSKSRRTKRNVDFFENRRFEKRPENKRLSRQDAFDAKRSTKQRNGFEKMTFSFYFLFEKVSFLGRGCGSVGLSIGTMTTSRPGDAPIFDVSKIETTLRKSKTTLRKSRRSFLFSKRRIKSNVLRENVVRCERIALLLTFIKRHLPHVPTVSVSFFVIRRFFNAIFISRNVV